ncbi:MAG: energy transducer TonB [Wenzhouxiangellaceae bacterium]|nr:energy transducer TonB [Wenzhouxiangellaceae bacterium]
MTHETSIETRKPGTGRGWRSLAAGLTSMVAGTVLVVGTLLVINRLSEAPDRQEVGTDTSFAVEKKPPPPPPPKQRREPPPRRRSTEPAPPMVNLDSSLSGIDFGLPGFSASELGSLQDELLGDTRNVVMTDDSVDAPPRPTYQAPLEYPKSARSKGVEGYVVLSLLISATGEIEKVQVLESRPSGVFEDAALQGVRNWRFEPAQYQGRNVKVWARQRVRFDLS